MYTPMHRLAAAALPLIICSVAAANEPVTHFSIAQEVINLLAETELLLNSCRDAESVAAAVPELQKLSEEAQAIKEKQLKLPDSSLQEDITIARQVKDFQNLWSAIQNHIERLQKDGLMSEELRKVLCIAPTTK